MNKALNVHLDPVGGIAGDMFVAAILDAWPELRDGVIDAVRCTGLGHEIDIEHRAHDDGILTGSRFEVSKRSSAAGDGHDHHHVHWRSIRKQLSEAPLRPSVSARAIDIFALLAEAEAGVHGVDVDEVAFHEVGAWDSIADIVAAAFLIEAIGAERWSVGPLPLGGGTVRTAHGDLPVPAPATARLLEGFTFRDDGRSGERVTPTGAAILKQLGATSERAAGEQRLLKTGYGFGLRRLEGMSNVLRAVAFEGERAPLEEVAVLSFEIDDQTPEDLAIGLDRLRTMEAVFDIVQMPVFGKKGRLATGVRFLVRPEAIESVIDQCFTETTTLGLRWHIEHRAVLARRALTSEDGIRLKRAERPGGAVTIKAESDDLSGIAGHAERQRVRKTAEDEPGRSEE
jgi:uncharacterized protein (TIGR00299 family) protein